MSEPRATGARVLVVDDEPAILRAVRVNLARHDFHVTAAETAGEAPDQYDAGDHDLILLDLSLPDLNGFEIITDPQGPRYRCSPGAECITGTLLPVDGGMSTGWTQLPYGSP